MEQKYSDEFLALLSSITNKRAKIVIEHILEHGFITSEDLVNKYGYNHPPRAVRDVREIGIPIETYRVKSAGNRSIAAYRFGDFEKVQKNKLAGRQTFSKEVKNKLFTLGEQRCYICNSNFDERYLQIDHKVPYEVIGDTHKLEQDIDDFMLLCGSCNRAKSWSCEHCTNWITDKKPQTCLKCYWGNPLKYSHLALKEIRRLDIQWEENEVKYFDSLSKEARKRKIKLPEFIKEIIEKYLKK